MNKIWEAWNLKVSNERTADDIAIQLYQEHICIATILEAFIASEKLEFKNLNQYVFSLVPSQFLWEMSVARFNLILSKMIRLGYLIADFDDKKQYFCITELGVKVWQEQTFQSLASASLFNYQSQLLTKEAHKLNKTSVNLNKSVLVVSMLSLIVAIVSIIIAVYTIKRN
jgi:hypothetical protein